MSKKEASQRIEINSSALILRLAIALVAIEIAFVILDAVINYRELSEILAIRRIFNIAREGSVPSWFGTTQTFMVGLTLWAIVLLNRMKGHSNTRIIGWSIIAAFFTYMAVDDGAEIHERIGTAFGEITENPSSGGLSSHAARLFERYPSYAWQFVLGPFFLLVGLFMLIFLWKELTDREGRILLVAAVLIIAFAFGLDFIEGLDADHGWNVFSLIKERLSLGDYTVSHFAKSLEEFLEMFAMTLLWVAFLRHFTSIARDKLIISFSSN